MIEEMIEVQLVNATIPGVGHHGDWVKINKNLYEHLKSHGKVRLRGQGLPGSEDEREVEQPTVMMKGGKVDKRTTTTHKVNPKTKPEKLAGGKR